MENHITLILPMILILGVICQWLANCLKIPSILFLVIVGLLIGPLTGFVLPQNDLKGLFIPIVKLSLAIILFEGGLNLQLKDLSQTKMGVRRLITLNNIISITLVTILSRFLFSFSFDIALVLGCILVVTGPTVILPMLKTARLEKKTSIYLKWEGLINDPLGVILAVLFLEFLNMPNLSLLYVIEKIGGIFIISLFSAYLAFKIFEMIAIRSSFPHYLRIPIVLCMPLIVYEAPNLFQNESGLIAVTILGIMIGNSKSHIKEDLKRFKDYLTILTIPMVFILLVASLDIETLTNVNIKMILFFICLMFVIRPLSIFISTFNTEISFNQKIFLSLIAPRGIVSLMLTDLVVIYLARQGRPEGKILLPLIFVIISGSVLLNGLYVGLLSKKLNLSRTVDRILIVGANSWTIALAQSLQKIKIPVTIADKDWGALIPVRMAGIPILYTEVLSEITEIKFDFSDVGNIIAASEINSYNSLVCTRFQSELGPDRVHQISFGKKIGRDIMENYHGAILIDIDFTYEKLENTLEDGWKFKVIRINKANISSFKNPRKTKMWPVLVLTSTWEIHFLNQDIMSTLNSSDQLLVYQDIVDSSVRAA